jgi:hypothetical protein
MALKVSQVDVWAATIEDRPGGMAAKLAALAKAGVNLEFVIARRTPEKPGAGVLFVTPVKGDKQVEAAAKAGFKKADGLHSVRIEAPDAPGLGARSTKALADAGINVRGLSAAAIGGAAVFYLAVDTSADAAKAADILRKLG